MLGWQSSCRMSSSSSSSRSSRPFLLVSSAMYVWYSLHSRRSIWSYSVVVITPDFDGFLPYVSISLCNHLLGTQVRALVRPVLFGYIVRSLSYDCFQSQLSSYSSSIARFFSRGYPGPRSLRQLTSVPNLASLIFGFALVT